MTIVKHADRSTYVKESVETLRASYLSGEEKIHTTSLGDGGQIYPLEIPRETFYGCYETKDGPAFWAVDLRTKM